MKQYTYLWAIPALLMLSSGQAKAVLVYENGPVQPVGITNPASYGGPSLYTTSNYVTDAFTLGTSATVTYAQIGLLAVPNSVGYPQTVQWSIAKGPYNTGGTVAGQMGSTPNPTTLTPMPYTGSPLTNPGSSSPSYQLFEEQFSLGSINLAAGTYWLTLQNAVFSNGTAVDWGYTNGITQAYANNGANPIYPESFELYNNIVNPIPEPATLSLAAVAVACLVRTTRRRMKQAI